MKKSQGQSGFLTNERLADEMEELTGLRPPPHGCARDTWAEYEVASMIMFQLKYASTPDEAAREAVKTLFEAFRYRIETLIPHIERAIGRPMTQGEKDAGALAA